MILYGASGHGKVIRDIIISNDTVVTCFFDDNPNLNNFESFQVYRYKNDLFHSEKLVISVGNNIVRKKISEFVEHKFGLVIHNSVLIGTDSKIDVGSVVMQGTVIQANSKIGKHSIINTSASIDHDCIIDDFVHISPHATLCGNVSVGEGTHFGAAAVAIPGIKIGKWCTIGAGSVIIKDIPDFAVVIGNPGRIIKYNKYK